MPGRPIVHIELSTRDRIKSADFYASLFGWRIEQRPDYDYALFESGNIGGGLNPISDDNPAGSIVVYVDSEDIDADLKRAEGLGAKILQPKMEIPGTGWFGVFIDPDGNKIALYTSLNPA